MYECTINGQSEPIGLYFINLKKVRKGKNPSTAVFNGNVILSTIEFI